MKFITSWQGSQCMTMTIAPMISVAGMRGIVGESLRVEEFFEYALAFGTLCNGGKVILGGDSRLSREMLRHMAFGALISTGCDVIDLGLVPTPTVGMMIRELGAAGGIAITASHNPAEWNAYKFFGPHGSFLDAEANARLLEIARTKTYRRVSFDKLGRVTGDETAIKRHVSKVTAAVDIPAIRRRNLHVVVDCVNGVGGLIATPLLEQLGCRATIFDTDTNSPFPRNPEPLPENLSRLGEVVRETGADIGFAIDPDADRLAIVGEHGNPLGEERTLVLAADAALRRGDAPSSRVIVANLSSTRALDDVAAKHSARLVRTRIGEAWVVAGIAAHHALIGGEGNGGVIFPEVHPGRDAAMGIALILEALALHSGPISALNATIPDYEMVKEKASLGQLTTADVTAAMTNEFASEASLDETDGVKAIFNDRWVHVRLSGTEPVVRFFAEGPTRSDARELVTRARQALGV